MHGDDDCSSGGGSGGSSSCGSCGSGSGSSSAGHLNGALAKRVLPSHCRALVVLEGTCQHLAGAGGAAVGQHNLEEQRKGAAR